MDEMHPAGAPHDRLITFVDRSAGHDLRYAIDPSRIREELGWRPQSRWRKGSAGRYRWYLENEDWWRPLQLARQGVGQRLGGQGVRLLVFGQTGQVARELRKADTERGIGRPFWGAKRPIFPHPESCAAAIASHGCDAVINAAAWTAVDKAEAEEAAATDREWR
jgi:hypothetical protein